MPKYWYSIRDNVIKNEDDEQTVQKKEFNRKIVAAHKPYFMTYVYPELRTKNNTYNADSNHGALMRFSSYGIRNMEDLCNYEPKTKEMLESLKFYKKKVGCNPCVVNRICKIFEKEFDGYISKKIAHTFDYSILKRGVDYSKKSYQEVLKIYKDYQSKCEALQKKSKTEKHGNSDIEIQQQRDILAQTFRSECEIVCSNESELCDIILDICYQSEKSKQFVWDICGNMILRNLLSHNGNIIYFPKKVESDGEFEYCGESFVMCRKTIGGDNNDCIK